MQILKSNFSMIKTNFSTYFTTNNLGAVFNSVVSMYTESNGKSEKH